MDKWKDAELEKMKVMESLHFNLILSRVFPRPFTHGGGTSAEGQSINWGDS